MITASRIIERFSALNDLPPTDKAEKFLKSKGIDENSPIFKKVKDILEKSNAGKQAGVMDILKKIQKLMGLDYETVEAIAAMVFGTPTR